MSQKMSQTNVTNNIKQLGNGKINVLNLHIGIGLLTIILQFAAGLLYVFYRGHRCQYVSCMFC